MQLEELGISVCCLNSAEKNSPNILNEIVDGEYSIVYVTPESALSLQYLFTELQNDDMLCMVAIDESHCVSLWGNSFRSSYTKLACIREWINDVPILTLTATATDHVIKDIIKMLKLEDPLIIKSSFDRPNLYIEMVQIPPVFRWLLFEETFNNRIHQCSGFRVFYPLPQGRSFIKPGRPARNGIQLYGLFKSNVMHRRPHDDLKFTGLCDPVAK